MPEGSLKSGEAVRGFQLGDVDDRSVTGIVTDLFVTENTEDTEIVA